MAQSLFDVVREHALGGGEHIASIETCGHHDPDLQPILPTALTYAKLHEAAERLACVLAMMLESSLAPSDEPSKIEPHSPSAVPACLSNLVIATWMWRSNAWYCIYCAAARLQVPSIAMSRDLPDAAVQRRRNEEILTTHRHILPLWMTVLPSAATLSTKECQHMRHGCRRQCSFVMFGTMHGLALVEA